jgi:hypothetical protein
MQLRNSPAPKFTGKFIHNKCPTLPPTAAEKQASLDVGDVPVTSMLELLQQIDIIAVRILETDHTGAPGLVLRLPVERYAIGP